MKLCQLLLRFLSPVCEAQRMELRHEMARAGAHAEDLNRTVILKGVPAMARPSAWTGPQFKRK